MLYPDGSRIPRSLRSEPDCGHCLKAYCWTPKNRALYRRWLLARRGIETGRLGALEAWAFADLEEAWLRLGRETLAADVQRAIARAFGG